MSEQGRSWRAWRRPGAWSLTGYSTPRPDESRASSGPAGPVRVVLVDDAAEVRALVRTKLRLSGSAVVEGEGSNGADAVDLARRLKPDAMLLDVSMPVIDGLTAVPQVLKASPATRIVMFSGFDEEPLALRALDLGASSYLTKTSSLEDVVAELLGAHDIPGADPPEEGRSTSDGDAEEDAEDAAGAQVLNEQVERFQSVFEDAAIGMATMTLEGSIVRVNDALSRILDSAPERLLGRPYGEAVGDVEGIATAVAEIVEKGTDVVSLEHPDGGESHLRTTLSVVRDRTGRALYLFAQCQDVTAQRMAEVGLRQSEQRFRLMVDVVRDYAIFMLDPEGHVASWNLGAERTKGWTADEIIGQHFRIFYPPEQQQSRHPEHELELAMRDGVYQEEGWRVRKDGSRFWAHVTITTVRDEHGRHVGFAKVTRDHTERMEMLTQQGQYAAALGEANTQLEAANAQLEEANAVLANAAEEQARFLAVTAHELRSPIGVVAMSSKLLSDSWTGLDDDEREELLAGMRSSAARLQRLLGDLLTTARLQASTLDLDIRDHDVAHALAPVLKRLRTTHPDLELEEELASGVTVRADADRLGQIVENLVNNALAHGKPPVRVTVRESGHHVEVAVSDSGAGVAQELQGRLFERFATRGRHGTGLGLHIVRELARAQGGDADYRDADNAFVVRLPRTTS